MKTGFTMLALVVLVSLSAVAAADNGQILVEQQRVEYLPAGGYEIHPYPPIYVPPPPVENPYYRPQDAWQPAGQPTVPSQPPELPGELRYQTYPVTQAMPATHRPEEGRAGKLGFGLCYTGPLVKYFVNDKFVVELRDYLSDDAYVIAPRLVGLFDLPKTEFYEFCYYGVEAGRVNFRGRVSRGGGSTVGCFVGIEKEIFQNIFLNVDAGPYWISIKDNQTGIRESGVDFVVNSSVCVMLR